MRQRRKDLFALCIWHKQVVLTVQDENFDRRRDADEVRAEVEVLELGGRVGG